jgi:hypothetical protein
MAETDSILDTTKKILNIDSEYTAFDPEIITHINSTFFELTQLGVGPTAGFFIIDRDATWTEFMEGEQINAVKSLMGLKVRLMFDPPQNSFTLDAMKNLVEKMEWRLNIHMEGVRYEAWLALQPTSSSDIMGSQE